MKDQAFLDFWIQFVIFFFFLSVLTGDKQIRGKQFFIFLFLFKRQTSQMDQPFQGLVAMKINTDALFPSLAEHSINTNLRFHD